MYTHVYPHTNQCAQRGVGEMLSSTFLTNVPVQGLSRLGSLLRENSLFFLEASLREDYKYLNINIVILVTGRNELMISWMLSGNDLGGSILCSVHFLTNSSLKSFLLRVRICHL